MIIDNIQLREELAGYSILIEEAEPRKTMWALYEPWPFEQDGIQYKAKIGLGQDLKGKARYLVLLHELAHYLADQDYAGTYGYRPHGKEWQFFYRNLLHKYRYLFPPEVQDLFPKYTSAKENELIELLNSQS